MNLLTDQLEGAWAFILGDDHVFEADTLLRLLKWNLPAVVALNVQRLPPYWPVVLQGEPGPNLQNLSWQDIPQGNGLWYPARDMYPGNAGLLLQRTLIDKLDKPIFRAGQFDPGIVNEDIYLIHSLKQQNVNIPIDLGVKLGHSNNLTAVPVLTNDGWRVDFYYSRSKHAFRINPQRDSSSE